MSTPNVFQMTQAQFQSATQCNTLRANTWFDPFNAAMALYAIDTPLRAAHFLAQVGHESLNLIYSKEIWGPTQAQLRYDPASGSSLAVALGNTQPGDGARYQGRGFIQITGRANYGAISKDLGKDFVANPVLLEQGSYPALSAVWFWHLHGCNELADADDLLGVTKRINGGTNGLADRQSRTDAAKKVFGI